MLNNSKYRIRVVLDTSLIFDGVGGGGRYIKEMAVFLHLSLISLLEDAINASGIFIMSSLLLCFRGSV